MPGARQSSKLRDILQVLPVAGVMCMMGAFGWAIWGAISFGTILPGPLMLGGLGIVFFLTTFISGEAANLKHYVNVSLYTAFVVGICVAAYIFVSLHDRQFDLTPEKNNTLSEQTAKYLMLLKKDVEVVVFDVDRRPYEKLLARYAALSPRFKWTIRDPRKDPLYTGKFDPIVIDGTIYVTHGENKKKRMTREELSEVSLTNAIVEVTRETALTVYFVTNHGELPLTPPEGRSAVTTEAISGFAGFLDSQSMQLRRLDLLERGFIPEDASLVIMAGPARDLAENEARALERYLAGGGKLLLFFDVPPLNAEPPPMVNFTEILRRRGLEMTDKMILDLLGLQQENNYLKVPLKNFNDQHKITAQLGRAGAPASIPLVRSIVSRPETPKDTLLSPLIASSNQAWAESYAEIQANKGQPSPVKEKMGQQAIAWAIEPAKPQAGKWRIVVFGASEPVKNRFYAKSELARELTHNAVNWLVEQEDLIAIPPRTVQGTPLILTNAQMQLILILVGFALPATIFFGGVSYVRLIRRS